MNGVYTVFQIESLDFDILVTTLFNVLLFNMMHRYFFYRGKHTDCVQMNHEIAHRFFHISTLVFIVSYLLTNLFCKRGNMRKMALAD